MFGMVGSHALKDQIFDAKGPNPRIMACPDPKCPSKVSSQSLAYLVQI